MRSYIKLIFFPIVIGGDLVVVSIASASYQSSDVGLVGDITGFL